MRLKMIGGLGQSRYHLLSQWFEDLFRKAIID
jgi:hypothetical protein